MNRKKKQEKYRKFTVERKGKQLRGMTVEKTINEVKRSQLKLQRQGKIKQGEN